MQVLEFLSIDFHLTDFFFPKTKQKIFGLVEHIYFAENDLVVNSSFSNFPWQARNSIKRQLLLDFSHSFLEFPCTGKVMYPVRGASIPYTI